MPRVDPFNIIKVLEVDLSITPFLSLCVSAQDGVRAVCKRDAQSTTLTSNRPWAICLLGGRTSVRPIARARITTFSSPIRMLLKPASSISNVKLDSFVRNEGGRRSTHEGSLLLLLEVIARRFLDLCIVK